MGHVPIRDKHQLAVHVPAILVLNLYTDTHKNKPNMEYDNNNNNNNECEFMIRLKHILAKLRAIKFRCKDKEEKREIK